MKSALVVFETVFGDNRTIARAVAEGLSGWMPVVVLEAREAPERIGPEVGLLVVGGPTHQFGMPRPESRQEAVRSMGGAHPTSPALGLREWLSALQRGDGMPAAAFDTRVTHPAFLRLVDHAAREEEKLLRYHGFDVVVPAEHFWVVDAAGPLKEGEADRAAEWGRTLAKVVEHRLLVR